MNSEPTVQMNVRRKEVFFFDGKTAECVLASDYDAVIAEAERFRFLLRHAHDALDYHYYPVLRGLIRTALGEPLNEHGQLTRDSLDKLENSLSDLGLHDDLGTAAGIKRMDERKAQKRELATTVCPECGSVDPVDKDGHSAGCSRQAEQ